MWNLKYKIISIINVGAGITTKVLRKHFEAIPGKHSIDSLKETSILRKSHIIWKVMSCES